MAFPRPSPYEPGNPSTIALSLQTYVQQELRKLSNVIAKQARLIEDLEARLTVLEP